MLPGRILQLLDELPPTPAVCGAPVSEARRLLQHYPDIDRSCYAGYLGPWGNGVVQLYVSLRCMQVFDGVCRLYAGGGLMPDSDEAQEWQETENKMACMRQAIAAGL
jgi:isochorismate synthase